MDIINDLTHLMELKNYIDKCATKEASRIAQDQLERYESDDVSLLVKSLCLAKRGFKMVKFNRLNPLEDLMYADLYALVASTQEALSDNELAITYQIVTPDDGSTILKTRLVHSSNQFIETRSRITPPSNDLNAFESTVNSHKRWSYMHLLGISITNDPGDDGSEKAMIHAENSIMLQPSNTYKPETSTTKSGVISKDNLEELERELEGHVLLGRNILDRLKLNSFADLPETQFRSTLTRIKRIKQEMLNAKG